MRRLLFVAWLSCMLVVIWAAAPAVCAGGTKTVSGKVQSVRGNVLTIQKPGLVSVGVVEVEMNDATKKIGQLVPGMHVKVKFHVEHGRKIALSVETQPEYASKAAKKAAKQTQP